ncbi:heavy-metal-associated domain-containing protein [Pseudarthrobacter sp. MDT3-26]|uniref:heavy-metal-associated domain-containing protein n=1 Tax=Pseudarthrobacter raffinosi TaxID=2953651 RepID=UPI00208E449F|nr:heavy-metal-associated domain-containing protein [Pseudarthrobacter sp. MDT3-26]MCO4264339.1 heavy-metal-associated domain-containing protein [Pseudarthrobacter sp. MDT3-26]
MSASPVRTELPIVAAETAGCSCCSTPSAKQLSHQAEGTEYSVTGLTCGHCVQTVEKAVTALDGVTSAAVELVAGGTSRLSVSGPHTETSVRDAVTAAGYSLSSR